MNAQTIDRNGESREVTPELIDELLAQRLRNTPGPALFGYTGSVVFHTGQVDWTIQITTERITVRRGRARSATTRLWTDMTTMASIVAGEQSGAEAFHSGALVIRGRIAFALLIDGAFLPPGERPANMPIPGQVMAQGVTTTYLAAGPVDAPPVLLLHGVGATNASMLPLLLDLAGDYRVIAPDLPGHGGSSAPPWSYSAADFSHWTRAFLARMGQERAVIIGNSLGGRIAIETALRHPDYVSELVLLNPSTAFRRLTEARALVRLIPPKIGMLPAPLHGAMVRYMLQTLFADPDRLPVASMQAAVDEFIGVMRSGRNRVAFLSALRQIYLEEAFGMAGFWDRLPRLTAPSLFVWGDHDYLVPASFASHVEKCLPDATSVVMRSCGHAPQFEHPAETAALVRRFLSGRALIDTRDVHPGFPHTDTPIPLLHRSA